ncbi:DUF6056 family protein [Butyrivibrio sp. AE3004]|uniref:DUF6056 family protein n=1 Tax=Butyrivibrio sp. AE3004 TaxID=1506994 RepID=UPI000493FD39|nr:DUF6056 family protein [Butyrivibrio sp. AE3004]
MKKNIKLKTLRIILFLINAIAIIPILYVACFNVPSADDFSMANEVHDAFISSGFFAAIFKAVYMGIWYYLNWTGVYFSNTLTALAPHVFGERLYFFGTWIVLIMFTVGLCYFLRQLLVGVLRLEKHLSGCITSVIYFILIQCMPAGSARVESLFWYSGAINYLFMFGLGLLWLGFILKLSLVQNYKKYKITVLSVIGFLLGGANYMTALSLGIISVCVLVISAISTVSGGAAPDKQIAYRKYTVVRISEGLSGLKVSVIPSVCLLLGLFLSMIAPGNSKRAAESAYNPVKAVLMAIYYTFDSMLGKWLNWQVVILIAFLVPLLWKAAGRIKRFYHFDHPLLFVSFSFLLTAASITPPIYATGSIEAGRIQALFYMQGMLLMILSIGYVCGWIRCVINPAKKMDEDASEKRKPADLLKDAFLGKYASGVIIAVGAAFIVFSVLAIKPEPSVFTGTLAAADILNGSATVYKNEFNERLKILKDENAKTAELSSYSVRPQILFFSDITKDENDWLNKAVAEYYHKDRVILKD